jgi:Leucine-rich repeat (LRR) protein
LRDKNIEYFEDNKADSLRLEELVNVEALYASHNLIKEIFGIAQLTTLVELNLSFNNISDILPLEDLVLLEKLWLNRNHIMIIDPLKKLRKLKTLGLFHNEIMNDKRTIEVLEDLSGLSDLSIDGNPVSAKVSFKYELIYRFKNLETLDDEAVKEMDRDIAEQYFI